MTDPQSSPRGINGDSSHPYPPVGEFPKSLSSSMPRPQHISTTLRSAQAMANSVTTAVLNMTGPWVTNILPAFPPTTATTTATPPVTFSTDSTYPRHLPLLCPTPTSLGISQRHSTSASTSTCTTASSDSRSTTSTVTEAVCSHATKEVCRQLWAPPPRARISTVTHTWVWSWNCATAISSAT